MDPDKVLAREAAMERALEAWEREQWLILFRAQIGGRLAERFQREAHESILGGSRPISAALLEAMTEAILRADREGAEDWAEERGMSEEREEAL